MSAWTVDGFLPLSGLEGKTNYIVACMQLAKDMQNGIFSSILGCTMPRKDEREGDMASTCGRRRWLSRSSKDIASKFKMAGSTNLRGRLPWTALGYYSDVKTLWRYFQRLTGESAVKRRGQLRLQEFLRSQMHDKQRNPSTISTEREGGSHKPHAGAGISP